MPDDRPPAVLVAPDPRACPRPRSRAWRPPLPALAAAVLAASWAWGGAGAPAYAQLVRELVPLLSIGVTDNADANDAVRRRDEFATGAITARVRYQAARSNHTLANHLSLTFFFEGAGYRTVSDSLSWISAFDLSATLQLHLLGNGSISRGSGVDPGDLSAALPQATRGTQSTFLSFGAGEELVYKPTPVQRYSESVNVSQVRYLSGVLNALPNTTLVAADLRGEWNAARDTIILDALVSDSYVPRDAATVNTSDFALGHTFLGQILLGWRRELSAFWSSEVEAGPMFILKPNGDGIVAPSGMASLTYKSFPWFATLVVSQSPTPNLFVGEVTVSTQALLRLSVPLNRQETFLVAGYAGYIYARLVTGASGDLTRGFDQINAGASLLARSQRHPFWAALSATLTDQRGNNLPDRMIPDLLVRTVLLSVGAAFAFGPGTPSVFGGAL